MGGEQRQEETKSGNNLTEPEPVQVTRQSAKAEWGGDSESAKGEKSNCRRPLVTILGQKKNAFPICGLGRSFVHNR